MSQWISVNDRLPDTDEVVLAVLDGKVEVVRYRYWQKLRDKPHGVWKIVTADEDCNVVYDAYYPSHWMPIPQPPQSIDNTKSEIVQVDEIKLAMDNLTNEQRMEVFSNYCHSCGDKDPSCPCWNDD